MKKITFLLIIGFFTTIGFSQGSLNFEANGEDFVRQGFVTKDGWSISFNHVFVNLSNIRAYQTNPPFEGKAELVNSESLTGLSGSYYIDLAEGDENAAPILVGTSEATEGFFNAISWHMKATDEPSLKLEGTASKDGETISFMISSTQAFEYSCGTFIGDERKGIVQDGATAVTEMTFHLDHIFGDIELDMNDSLNEGALGFAPFAATAQDGLVDLNDEQLAAQLSEEDYLQLSMKILPNLGHVGEGHCFERLSSGEMQ